MLRRLAIAVAAMAIGARAQPSPDYQSWVSATVQGDALPDLRLHFDATLRLYDDFTPAQIEMRPGVGVRIAEGMHVWAGYVWIPFWSPSKTFGNEHRAWEQWSWSPPAIETISLFLRARLEERWRPDTSFDMGLRLRLLARTLIPIVDGSPLHISIWNEGYLGFNEARSGSVPWQRIGFIENQLFVGIGCNVDRHRFELGYLNHWLETGQLDVVRHVVAFNASLTVD